MILNALAEKLKRRAKDDFKGRHFEARLILQAVAGRLVVPPLSAELPRHRGAVPGARPGGGSLHPEPLGAGLRAADRASAAALPQTSLWLDPDRRNVH